MSLRALPRRVWWSLYLGYHVLGQARYPFRSAERIARDRDRNVQRIVAYAYRWVPYYRQTMDRLGLRPTDVRGFDDLRKLPLISVSDLQADPAQFDSTEHPKSEMHRLDSSGSTGRPHSLWHDLASTYLDVAVSERESSIHRRIIGKGRRLVALGLASPINATSLRGTIRANAIWPSRANMWRGAEETPLYTYDPPAKMLAVLNKRRPDIFYAYGSTMAMLFAYAQRHNAAIHAPKIARYASDALPPAVRQMITEQYGTEVFSAYQSIEAPRMGFECEAHTGYHNNCDVYPVRIVDEAGADCPPGVVGEVVVSNLVSHGTVLLNYRLGDRASWATVPCTCGRQLPLISFPQGRVTDDLVATDGRRLDYPIVIVPMMRHPGVWQCQVTQHALDSVTIALQLAPGTDSTLVERDLRAALQPLFGTDMHLNFEFDGDLQRTVADKLRYVIREFEPPAL